LHPATDPSHSLSELVEWILAGELEVPIAAVYPLDRVQEAFREIEQTHARQDRPPPLSEPAGVLMHGDAISWVDDSPDR